MTDLRSGCSEPWEPHEVIYIANIQSVPKPDDPLVQVLGNDAVAGRPCQRIASKPIVAGAGSYEMCVFGAPTELSGRAIPATAGAHDKGAPDGENGLARSNHVAPLWRPRASRSTRIDSALVERATQESASPNLHDGRTTQRGQAIIELLVAALVLIPLFLLMPLVDIKQATIAAKR
jgi:hypothetical protein